MLDVNGKHVLGYVGIKKFMAAGGNPQDPQPQTLVALGRAKDVAQVKRVFLSPHFWDLIVWVTPNPNGAFADKNPLVKVTNSASSM